jgi:hypothetical protein
MLATGINAHLKRKHSCDTLLSSPNVSALHAALKTILKDHSLALSVCNTGSTSLVHKIHVSLSAGNLSRWFTV